jgi:hypothetical protein
MRMEQQRNLMLYNAAFHCVFVNAVFFFHIKTLYALIIHTALHSGKT